MGIERNNNNMMERQINLWKSESKAYLKELEHFLDIITNIQEENLRRDVLMTMIRCDNELTLLAEKLFRENYSKGVEDGKSEDT